MKKSFPVAAFLLCMSLTCIACSSDKKAEQNKKPAAKPAVTATEATAVAKTKPEVKPQASQYVPKPSDFKDKPYLVVDCDYSNLPNADPGKPVYDLLSVQERQAKGLPTELPPIQQNKNGKIAYLTFDDGPEGKNTPAILDILKREGVKGTFYVVGSYCYDYPDTLLRMFVEGHAIGNHSFTHDYHQLYPSVDGFLNEMYRTEEALRAILGFRSMIVRAPGGKVGMFTSAYPPALKKAGLVEHGWNVCIDDSVGGHPTAADFIRKVSEQTADGKSCAVVLMHCTHGKDETVKALPGIIQLLRERGYAFDVVTPATPQI